MDLSKQYNNFAKKFSDVHDVGENSNRDNRKVFYDLIDFIKPGMKLLDLGCGDGLDLVHYKSLGAEVYGIDASEELVEMAKRRLPDADVKVCSFEKLSFTDNYFDGVLSKYAIQTAVDLKPVFSEVSRVLKQGGVMMYLVTHPLRQFVERREKEADYFKQKIVDSRILNNSIIVKEPTHTMNEYLNKEFMDNFEIKFYQEYWDAVAEQIDNMKYPGYFILKAKRV